uniref:Uncharacterized protein n=1 Tax=Oryza brachyantha TaxID=4533 RepID=J3N9Y3_ORYBR
MAHLTNNAVDSALAFLTKAVKEEAKLLSTVEADIQFIKDELDSMNGFLMYLTKTKTKTHHDDQVRAWMKQVRDLAYVADDCVKLYRRDLRPPEPGFWPWLRHIPTWVRTAPRRHRLANKIHKLKERVREVGERRQRYDVNVPRDAAAGDGTSQVAARDGNIGWELLEESSLRALDAKTFESIKYGANKDAAPARDAASQVLKIILDKRERPANVAAARMLGRALSADLNRTSNEKELADDINGLLENLQKETREAGVANHVMVFCYSRLSTHQKSCLQYLTTFDEEKSISRTCLIRRWLAEGTVSGWDKQQDEEDDPTRSMEEAGERCFRELVYRGFISPAPAPPAGLKIKSCVVDPSVKNFISRISKADNFIDDLPTHLRHQIDIRKLVQRQPPQPQRRPWWWCPPPTCVTTLCGADEGKQLPPVDAIVKLLKQLPEEYRLNVLDLGGCVGLTMTHLTTICDLVPSLKYLSLRKTNIYWLPKQMNNLLHLETLDIRDTRVQANAMRGIFLQELRHLLAGCVTDDEAQLHTVRVPDKLGKNTEILKHVRINDGRHAQAKLARVGSLARLWKLGVVLSGSQENMARLLAAIASRSDSLRSLSVWITAPPGHMAGAGDGGITLRHSLLTKDGLSELGKLTSLRCLRLRRESYVEDKVTLREGEFVELRFLLLDHVSSNTKKLRIEPGAAPMLKNIAWNMDSNMAAGIMAEAGNISGFDDPLARLVLKINGDTYRQYKPSEVTVQ